jgi:SulP family sulfate permease
MNKVLFTGMSKYTFRSLKKDFLAALAVTAIAVPESLGFAAIVGVPLEAGLYTALFAPLVYAFFASSKRLVVGADSATAAIVAAGAGLVAAAGTKEYGGAVVMLGLLVALFLVLASILKLGFLASLVSRPVLIGMFAGIGIQLMVGKLPEMLGIAHRSGVLENIRAVIFNVSATNWMTVTVSILVVGIIVLSRKTRIPGEIIGLVAACLFGYLFHIERYGVTLVGALPGGIPEVALPPFSFDMMLLLVPTALAITMVIIAQSATTIKTVAAEHDEKVDINRDLLALGFANAASALGRGFVANGSPPRTIAADMMGATSQMVNVFTALFVAILVVFGGSVFHYVPSAALAAIVFAIGMQLFRLEELAYLWRTHKSEFAIALIAMGSVALLGVRQGILIAIAVSLLERLSRQYRPRDQVLLRDGELSTWAESRLGHHTHHDIRPDGVLLYSFEGSLFFENADYFSMRLQKAISAAKKPVHYVVVDAGPIESIDYTAVEMLKTLYRRLSADNIKLGFAHVSPHLQAQFDEYGVTDLVGMQNIYQTLSSVILSNPEKTRSSIEAIKSLGLDAESYVVVGGAVLEALGLRDTKDIDIAVTDEVYALYRDEHHWHEYRLENGKKVLSHDGFNLVHSWVGYKWKSLSSDPMIIDGIPFLNPQLLLNAKKRLGRRKDASDARLVASYLSRQAKNHASSKR